MKTKPGIQEQRQLTAAPTFWVPECNYYYSIWSKRIFNQLWICFYFKEQENLRLVPRHSIFVWVLLSNGNNCCFFYWIGVNELQAHTMSSVNSEEHLIVVFLSNHPSVSFLTNVVERHTHDILIFERNKYFLCSGEGRGLVFSASGLLLQMAERYFMFN